MSASLISIIGPPAAGKTTLAEKLAELLEARVIYEDYAGNPFLADSYSRADSGASLPAQLYYLISRVAQLAKSSWPEDGLFVSDYGFCQDRIFAEEKLSPDDFAIYEKLLSRLGGLVRRPGVMVHLDACEKTLLRRIARRGRAFEKTMTAGFIASLRRRYDKIQSRVGCAVIFVDCDATDLRRRSEVEKLIDAITRIGGLTH